MILATSACASQMVALPVDDLIAAFTPQPPRIDGDLLDAAWSKAQPVESFTLAQSTKSVPKKTSIRAAFDEVALYLGIECAEPRMSKVKAERRKRDGNAWEDDCVEVFLRPDSVTAGYLQLIFNTLESIEDYRSEERGLVADWNPTWEVKVLKLAQGWQAEVAIPFKELEVSPSKRGDVWGLKLGREDHTQLDAAGERTALLYTWPPGTGYGGAADYGALVFEGRNCVRNADFSKRVGRKFEDWDITTGDEDRFEATTSDGTPTLRFQVPANKNAWIVQLLQLQPKASYRLSAEVSSNVNGYLQVRPEQEKGREAPRLIAAISPTSQFQQTELDFPSGPFGRVQLTIGNSGGTGKEAQILLRKLAVEPVRRNVLPDYMTWERIEPDPLHGLKSFMERHGIKPYERLHELDVDGCERLVFRDTVTGTEIWKLTNDSVPEGHDYALWTPYSANGAHLWFGSRRWIDGTTRATYCVMESTGDGVRMLTPWYNLSGWWHPRDGDVYFYLFQGSDHYELARVNARTMQKKLLANLPVKPGVQIAEPGPWSGWLLIVYPDALTGELVKMDGSERHEVKFPVAVGETHFSRAHKDVFYSTFHQRTGKGGAQVAMRITSDGRLDPSFLILDTSQDRNYLNMRRGGHGQSSPDETMYAQADGTVTLPDGTKRQIIVPGYLTDYPSYIGNNGYVSWRVTPEWLLYNNGPQVVKLWADGNNVQNLCFFNTISTTYYSLPWACSSPDGTKLVYRSTMTGNVEFYQAVVSKPLPPVRIAAKTRQSAVELTWQAPAFHKEVAGYLVYRSDESGRGYRQLTPQPVPPASYTDTTVLKGRTCYYVVSSVEHSGLESAYSAEVCATPPLAKGWQGAVRHFYEAEFATLEQPVLMRRSPLDASNMHYISASDYLQDKLQKSGAARFSLEVPKTGTYRLLGRVRAKAGTKVAEARLLLDAKLLSDWTIAGGDWQWTAAGKLPMTAGQHTLRWLPADSTFELDGLCLTDDAKFVPRGIGLCDNVPPPNVQVLKAETDGPFAIALSWQPGKATDLSHYNVYASRQPGFAPSQATRVGSVYRPAFLDWGLKPDTAYYYHITAVDRGGNEGPPSAQVTARTGTLPTATVIVEAESGRGSGEARLQEDAEASQKKAIGVPELGTTGTPTRFVPGKATGALTVDFTVPEDGAYVVWGRFRSIWREASLTLSIDGNRGQWWPITFGYHHEKAYMIWGRGATASYLYCWCEAQTNTCPDPRPFLFQLRKGGHRLDLTGLGEGLSVDQLAITNDFSWTPQGVRNYY